MATSGSDRRPAGSYAVRSEEPRRRKFPWWLLLLGLAALFGVLFFACGRNQDPSADVDAGAAADGGAAVAGATEEDSAAADGGSAVASATEGGADGAGTRSGAATEDAGDGSDTEGTASGGGAGNQPGTLVVGDTDVLPGAADQITHSGGQVATASQVLVESVVSDEGFWVGQSSSDRVFVRLRTDGESPFQVEAGQTVSFEGTVAENPADIEGELGVTAAEGADLLQRQGSHVEVPEVQLDQEA